MVVAYNPKSKYASQFKAIADGKKPLKDLFTLLETPGFKLGRTDPNIDPQGRDFIYMLELAQMLLPPAGEHGGKILGGADRLAELVPDLRRVLAGLDAAVRPARRGQRVHHPGDRAAPALHHAAGRDQPGRLRRAAQYAKATMTITARRAEVDQDGSPLVIDITIIGKPTPAGDRVRRVHAVPGGPGPVQAGRVHAADADGDRDSSAVPAAMQSELGG